MNSPREALHLRRVAQHRQRVQAKQQQIAAADKPIQAAVRQKYGPQEDLVNRQIAQSQQQQGRINDYYGAYQQAVQAAVQQQKQAQQAAQSSLSNEAAAANATDAQARTQLQGQMQQSAAQRGATVDPNIAATGIQAEASRRAGVQSALANVGQQGLAAVTRTSGQGPVGEQRRILAQQGESGRQQTLRQGLQTLKGQEADYAVGLREQAAKDELNRQIAQQGLNIKTGAQTIAQQNADTSAAVARSLAGHRTQQDVLAGKKFSSSQARDAYLRAHGLGPYRPPKPAAAAKGARLSPQQALGVQTKIGQARGWIDRLVQLYGHAKTPHDIRGLLMSGGRIQTGTTKNASGKDVPVFETVPAIGNADLINAAYDLHSFGGITRPNIVRLWRNARYVVPGNWRSPKLPAPKAPQPTSAGAAVGQQNVP